MSLIAWYPLIDDAVDRVGGGTAGGTPVFGQTGSLIGGQAEFDGTTTSRGVDTKPMFNTDTYNNFSVSCWINCTVGGRMLCPNSNGVDNYITFDTANELIRLSYCERSDLNERNVNTPNGSAPAGVWNHVVMTAYQNKFKVYVNGILGIDVTEEAYMPSVWYNWWKIGMRANSTFLITGSMCDVRFYDHILSSREVIELSRQKVLHYNFNDEQEPAENLSQVDNTISDMNRCGINYDYVGKENGWTKYSIRGTATTDTYPYTFSFGRVWVGGSTPPMSASFYLKTNVPEKFNSNFGDTTMVNIPYDSKTHTNDGEYHKIENIVSAGVGVQTQSIYIHSNPIDGVVFNPSTDFIYVREHMVVESRYAKRYTPINRPRVGYVRDLSPFGNDANLGDTNPPRWVQDGPSGTGCYYFDGTNTLSTNKLFTDDVNQRWTLCAWVKISDTSIGQQYINNFNSGNAMIWSSARGLLYLNSGTNDSYVYSSTMPQDEWIFLTYVHDTATTRCQIYKNGILDRSSTNYSPTDIPSGFKTTTIFGHQFTGYMTDIQIYATALDDAAIQELYEVKAEITKNGETFAKEFVEEANAIPEFQRTGIGHFSNIDELGVSDGLIGYWDFTEGQCRDLSGYGNHGTSVGAAHSTEGLIGGYYNLGNITNVDMTRDLTLVADFTLSTDTFVDGTRLGLLESHYTHEFAVNIDQDRKIQWYKDSDVTAGYQSDTTSGSVPLNEQTVWIGTYEVQPDGNTAQGIHYINNIKEAPYGWPKVPTTKDTSYLVGSSYTGALCDRAPGSVLRSIRIYDRALSEAEVSVLYDSLTSKENKKTQILKNGTLVTKEIIER